MTVHLLNLSEGRWRKSCRGEDVIGVTNCKFTRYIQMKWPLHLLKRRVVLTAAVVVVVIGAVAGAFFVGDGHALGALQIQQVTPDQMATAMHNDEFYSNYRESTLLVRGTVASIEANGGGATIEFKTSVTFTTSCQLSQYPTTVHAGDDVTAVTEGATAQRLTSGVSLSDCVLM